MKKERMLWPDILRIIASFFVVLIHVTSVGISDYEVGSLTWGVNLFLNSIGHWAIPVFFMISGMLFLSPERELPVKKLFTQYVRRVVLCIVVWGFLYSLLDQYIYSKVSVKSIAVAIYGILTGNTGYHMWFLYVLLILYITTPILRILIVNATKRQLQYVIVVWFLFSLCVGQLNYFAEFFLGTEELLPYNALVITGHSGYFLIGYYFKAYPVSKKWRYVLYIAALLLIATMPVVNILLSCFTGEHSIDVIISPTGIYNCVVASAVFVFVSNLRENGCSERIRKSFHKLAERTFGIYLLHVLFIFLIFRILKADFLALCPPVMALGYCVIIYTLSLLSAWILSKFPIVKKLV